MIKEITEASGERGEGEEENWRELEVKKNRSGKLQRRCGERDESLNERLQVWRSKDEEKRRRRRRGEEKEEEERKGAKKEERREEH